MYFANGITLNNSIKKIGLIKTYLNLNLYPVINILNVSFIINIINSLLTFKNNIDKYHLSNGGVLMKICIKVSRNNEMIAIQTN